MLSKAATNQPRLLFSSCLLYLLVTTAHAAAGTGCSLAFHEGKVHCSNALFLEDLTSECGSNQAKERVDCSESTHVFNITDHADVGEVRALAFAEFGGTVHISGEWCVNGVCVL